MNFRVLFAAIMAVFLAVPAYATESPEGYNINAYSFMVDGSGNQWTQGSPGGTGQGNVVLKNGSVISGAYTHFMYYHNHTVYWQQNNGSWFYLNGSTVTSTTDPRSGSPPCTPSVNATTVTSTSGSICDASGNAWTLTTGMGLQVTKNGTQQGTANVVLMYYDNPNDRIYQENSDGGWWYTAANGTVSWVLTVDPRPTTNCTSTSWCDDFNGTTLGADQHMNTSSRWGYTAQWNTQWDGYNVGAGRMINPLYSGTTGSQFSNLYKLDGSGDLVLGIDAAGSCTTACGSEPYISGQLISTQPVTPGHYVEARVKTTATKGANFAVWLYGDYSGSGGIAQEIDILEDVYFSDGTHAATQTIHHNPSGSQEQWADWSIDMTQWHTVGVYWTATSVCFYIDRTQTGCNASSVTANTGAMNIYLSSQDGGSWTGGIPPGTTMPASMTVDYVRVYDYKPF